MNYLVLVLGFLLVKIAKLGEFCEDKIVFVVIAEVTVAKIYQVTLNGGTECSGTIELNSAVPGILVEDFQHTLFNNFNLDKSPNTRIFFLCNNINDDKLDCEDVFNTTQIMASLVTGNVSKHMYADLVPLAISSEIEKFSGTNSLVFCKENYENIYACVRTGETPPKTTCNVMSIINNHDKTPNNAEIWILNQLLKSNPNEESITHPCYTTNHIIPPKDASNQKIIKGNYDSDNCTKHIKNYFEQSKCETEDSDDCTLTDSPSISEFQESLDSGQIIVFSTETPNFKLIDDAVNENCVKEFPTMSTGDCFFYNYLKYLNKTHTVDQIHITDEMVVTNLLKGVYKEYDISFKNDKKFSYIKIQGYMDINQLFYHLEPVVVPKYVAGADESSTNSDSGTTDSGTSESDTGESDTGESDTGDRTTKTIPDSTVSSRDLNNAGTRLTQKSWNKNLLFLLLLVPLGLCILVGVFVKMAQKKTKKYTINDAKFNQV